MRRKSKQREYTHVSEYTYGGLVLGSISGSRAAPSSLLKSSARNLCLFFLGHHGARLPYLSGRSVTDPHRN